MQKNFLPDATKSRSLFLLSLSGADDQVETLPDRLDDDGNLVGVVLGISIEENKDVWVSLLRFCQYALDGYPFASVFVVSDHSGTGQFGNPGGVIATSIINDNDLVSILLCLDDYTCDIFPFIIRGYANNDVNLAFRVRSLKSEVRSPKSFILPLLHSYRFCHITEFVRITSSIDSDLVNCFTLVCPHGLQ